MSTALPQERPASAAAIFAGYAPDAGALDELAAPDGSLRPHWRQFVELLEQVGADELSRRWEQADRLIRENGMTYNPYGDPEHGPRPWDLDPIPLLISPGEWSVLSAGLLQRARLLNLVLADIYGPQRLLSSGLVPADLIFSHAGFLRPLHGQRLREDRFLHFYAADLARAPDGRWWVIGDRTDAPLGVGYALENRIVLSRMLPGIIRGCNVQRLATFFITLRETLRTLAPEHRENPRIVLLSQGPANPNYFEDAYLARYLGYTLVGGGDLAVREDRVFLKTLGGLLPIDVIFRRLGDRNCDPLELHGDPTCGVAGLLQAVRAGNVAIANALGSSLVESAAFLPFLPNLCQQLLGEELLLPSLATWWCGTAEARRYALENLDHLTVRSAYRLDRQDPIPAEALRSEANGELARWIEEQPAQLVAQEEIARSTAPVWRGQSLRSARVAMRVFLVATNKSYAVLPGGLVRVSPEAGNLDLSILAGEGSKDVWVLSEGPVGQVSLLQPAGQPMELRRSGAELPSRVADNVFWLGRRTERAEGSARLLRPILVRLTSEAQAEGTPELFTLLHCLAAQGQIEPGFVVEGIRQQLPNIEQSLPAVVLSEKQAGSLRSTVDAMYCNASLVRDRLSLDGWRILHRIQQQMQTLPDPSALELSDLLELLQSMIIHLAAFDGLVEESMTRTEAWRFLDLGRRLERALHTIALVRSALAKADDDNPAVLEAVLEVADSIMTYRARYLASFQWPPALDLLLTDESNPRSLAFQLAAIADHVENLPRDAQPLRGAEQRIAISALNSIRVLDPEVLYEKRKPGKPTSLDQLLARLAGQLPKLCEFVSHKYLIHAGVPRQLA